MSLVGLLDKIQLREELWRELSLVWRMCSAMSAEKRETLDHTTTIANMCQLCSRAAGVDPRKLSDLNFELFVKRAARCDVSDHVKTITEDILKELFSKQSTHEPPRQPPVAEPRKSNYERPGRSRKLASIGVLAFIFTGLSVSNNINPSGAATPLSSPAALFMV